MKPQPFYYFLLATTLFAACGATCNNPFMRPHQLPAPQVLTGIPSSAELIQRINANSQPIRSLQSTNARLSAPGAPALRANIVLERPQRFRLIADTSITGTELDLGSNDEFFWMWAKRNDPPAVFYGRHDQFAQTNAAHILPVKPTWLAQAMGVVNLDPNGQHEGPFPIQPNKLQLRSTVQTPKGPQMHVTVVDDRTALILEQHVYDSGGVRIATSITSKHIYDPVMNVSLPGKIEIQLPPANLNFHIDVPRYSINQLAGNPAQLWNMPQDRGQYIDLAGAAAPPVSQPIVAPPSPPPRTSYHRERYGDYPQR